MYDQSAVESSLREIELHVAAQGWDQPTRLFALVATDELLAREPALVTGLEGTDALPALTSVEQEDLPSHEDLTDLLTNLSWPPSVLGVALVAERIVLPDNADAALPDDRAGATAAASQDPRRHELRLAAAGMREGTHFCLLRLRDHDHDDALLGGPNLISGLTDLIHASLAD